RDRSEPFDIAIAPRGEDAVSDDAEGAQAVVEGTREAGLGGEVGVDVHRVHVAGQPVDRRLLEAGVALDDDVRLTRWRLCRRRCARPSLAAPTAATDDEQAGGDIEE